MGSISLSFLWNKFRRFQKFLPKYLRGNKRPKKLSGVGADKEYEHPIFPKFGVLHPVSDSEIRKKMAEIGEKLAKEYAKRLRTIIELQLGDWVPLTAAYLNYKIKNKLDTRILIATGTYLSLIDAREVKPGLWVVNVPPTPLPNGSGYTYQDLAYWLEYGTEKMPPRPHWRLVARQMANRPQQLSKVYSEEVAEVQAMYLSELASALGMS